MPETTVLCFGTFDVLHKGHEYFLKQARSLGSRLVVSVARDQHVRDLKNKEPRHDEKTRLAQVKKLEYVDKAVFSDEVLGSYRIIEKIKPEVVAFGYDQKALKSDCQTWLAINRPETQIQVIDYLKTEKIPLNLD